MTALVNRHKSLTGSISDSSNPFGLLFVFCRPVTVTPCGKEKEPGRFVRAVAVRRPCLGYPASADKQQVIRERFQYLLQCGNIVFFGRRSRLLQGMVIVRGNSVKGRQTCLVSDFKFRSESGDIVSVVRDRRFPGACIAACTDRMSELVPSGCGVSSHRCSKERLPVGIVLPSAVAA